MFHHMALLHSLLLNESVKSKEASMGACGVVNIRLRRPFSSDYTAGRESGNAHHREPREVSSNAGCVPGQGRTDFKILFWLSRTQTTGIFQILPGFEIGLQCSRIRTNFTPLQNAQ